MEYTKGDWEVTGSGKRIWVKDGDGVGVTPIVEICGDNEESEANAHLVASSPALYEALKEIAGYIGNMDDIGKPHLTALKRTADKALAQADGK